MSSPRDKVLELLAAGHIGKADAEALLTAIDHRRPRLEAWLLEPCEQLGPAQAWALGTLVFLSSLGLSRLGVRFDGALDLHLSSEPVPWRAALGDQLAAWPLAAATFALVTLLSRRRVRWLELLGFVGAARVPHLIAGSIGALVATATGRLLPESAAELVLVGFIVPLLGWSFLTLLSAFRVASGAQGRGLVVGFFTALAAAEVLSKLVLAALL